MILTVTFPGVGVGTGVGIGSGVGAGVGSGVGSAVGAGLAVGEGAGSAMATVAVGAGVMVGGGGTGSSGDVCRPVRSAVHTIPVTVSATTRFSSQRRLSFSSFSGSFRPTGVNS